MKLPKSTTNDSPIEYFSEEKIMKKISSSKFQSPLKTNTNSGRNNLIKFQTKKPSSSPKATPLRKKAIADPQEM
jgi:hypothetical protein